jgi:oligopeptide transport system substrate-binding protein
MHYAGAFGTAYLTVNCLPMLPEGGGKNPLADKRVRQALCLAIDKEQIVRNITRVGEQPATTYIPPRVFKGYDAGPGLGRDLDRARRLLAEAGFPDGKDFPPLTLLYRSDRNLQRDIVQNLARQWELNLGLKNFRIENAEPKAVKERVGGKTKRFHIAPSNWYGDYADPSTFTDKFKSTSLGNDCAWNNPEYDAACNQAVLEPDPVKRYQLLAKAEHILNEWVPIIPLYHPVNTYLFDANKIEGLYLHPRDTIMFKSLVVKRK